MLQEEKELRLNQLKLIVIVMTLIFLFMLVYTIYFLIDYKNKYNFFEKTSAEVIEHQKIDGKEYDLLSYKVNGNEFRITTEYESKNKLGDTIIIYYDKNNPLGVVYSLDARRIWLPILVTIFGVGNLGLVILYFVIKKGVFVRSKVVAQIQDSDDGIKENLKINKKLVVYNKNSDSGKVKNKSNINLKKNTKKLQKNTNKTVALKTKK